eukprot:CAMPEP_0184493132 /NCGR_PEP_ID=MMETSP0113_2-20130426/25180_1 /TAXON_ID=91329 /ORGANISM="Norrisiella sphaerica, Strain BC52" /LENGTH=577 /DNA_ID=CAMNT_0026878275 /DNA_START=106 /DNA_END=1839 /DNA_ORIENTATION=+
MDSNVSDGTEEGNAKAVARDVGLGASEAKAGEQKDFASSSLGIHLTLRTPPKLGNFKEASIKEAKNEGEAMTDLTSHGLEEGKGEDESKRHRRIEQEETQIRVYMKRLWPLLIFTAIYVFSNVARVLLFFFLRTTIECGSETPEDFDRSSREWSGSRYCNDRCKVTSEATFLNGIAAGVEQFAQVFCLPAAGVLSDAWGRKFPYTITFVGFSLSFFTLSGAALLRRGSAVLILVMLHAFIIGATDSFPIILNTSITDLFKTIKGRGYTYGVTAAFRFVYSGLGLIIITATIIAENTYDYGPTFLTFAVLDLLASIFLPLLLVDTNVSPSGKVSCAKLSPLNALTVLREDEVVMYIGILNFCVVSSISVISIAVGYVIGAYGYTQIEAVYIAFAIGFLAFLATCAAPCMISRFGNRRTLKTTLLCALIGLCILCFSPISQIFFFLGFAFLALAVTGVPAYQALLSQNVKMDKMGRTIGAVGTLGIIATAIFTPLYASVFRLVGAGGDCADQTDLRLAWIPWGISACFMGGANLTLHLWFRSNPASLVSQPLISLQKQKHPREGEREEVPGTQQKVNFD